MQEERISTFLCIKKNRKREKKNHNNLNDLHLKIFDTQGKDEERFSVLMSETKMPLKKKNAGIVGGAAGFCSLTFSPANFNQQKKI